MINKNYLYGALACAVLVVALILKFQNNPADNIEDHSSNLEAIPSSSVSPSASPLLSSGPTPKSSPGVNIKVEKGYMDWAVELDKDSRYFIVNENCGGVTPSNVIIKNNSLIMLDNSKSSQPQTVRIGERSYDLPAYNWHLTTLYSAKVPADLGIYCGGVELGSIRLE